MNNLHDTIRAVDWQADGLHLLDQRRLPQRQDRLVLTHVAEVARAIRDMVVRGAPAIGIAAAYGVVLAARDRLAGNAATWKQAIEEDFTLLAASRPTAVNLFWALARMRKVLQSDGADPVAALLAEAHRIHEEDISANRRMGELGAALIEQPCAVMTHCNTGSLATGGYGTALGVIRSAFAAGKITKVFAGETRPWLQGARLTAWELVQDEIPVTLLVEGAASRLLQQGEVGWVVVGADRIAANGDTANKIGTYQLAVTVRYHGLKFMVVAPTSTIDLNIADGSAIPIENRAADEVLQLAGQALAARGAQAWNPAFDITPAALIDALVTERGVVLAPDRGKIQAMMEKA